MIFSHLTFKNFDKINISEFQNLVHVERYHVESLIEVQNDYLQRESYTETGDNGRHL